MRVSAGLGSPEASLHGLQMVPSHLALTWYFLYALKSLVSLFVTKFPLPRRMPFRLN